MRIFGLEHAGDAVIVMHLSDAFWWREEEGVACRGRVCTGQARLLGQVRTVSSASQTTL